MRMTADSNLSDMLQPDADSTNEINDTFTAIGDHATGTQLLSDWGKDLFIIINHVILSTGISLFGLCGNIINGTVFLKQGLRRSMNLSFFVLSLTDFCGLLTQVWHNFCLNPYIDRMGVPLDFMEIQFLTAGNPNACLVRVTCWITVYITAERCLSIAIPLKIKQIVTFERTVLILVFVYLINVGALVPLYFSAYFSWKVYPGLNRTLLGVSYRSNKLIIQDLLYIFQATLGLVAFAAVIIFTTILIVNLRRKSEWRKKSTYDKDQSTPMTSREKKTIRMVIVVACVLIVCYTPAATNSIVSSIVQDYTITGRQSNIFQAVWSFGFLFHSVNSSINIFLYYSMSSKYKATFDEMFPMFSIENVKKGQDADMASGTSSMTTKRSSSDDMRISTRSSLCVDPEEPSE